MTVRSHLPIHRFDVADLAVILTRPSEFGLQTGVWYAAKGEDESVVEAYPAHTLAGRLGVVQEALCQLLASAEMLLPGRFSRDGAYISARLLRLLPDWVHSRRSRRRCMNRIASACQRLATTGRENAAQRLHCLSCQPASCVSPTEQIAGTGR